MADPVSWFLIERGWIVEAADGTDLGLVDEVLADEEKDIFSGIAVSSGLFHNTRAVDAGDVAEISDGRVRLRVSADELSER